MLRTVTALFVAVFMVGGAAADSPEMQGDASQFYSASRPTYVAVDGARAIAFNSLMNLFVVSLAGAAPEPTSDVDRKCSVPGLDCVTLLGVAMAQQPRMGSAGPNRWKANGAEFQVTRCVDERAGTCRAWLMSSKAAGGAQGWYIISDARGVEAFGRLAGGGTSADVFVLFAETGLLVRR